MVAEALDAGMRWLIKIVLIVTAVLFAVHGYWKHERRSLEPRQLTQCFGTFEQSIEEKTPPLYRDHERGCVGLRWSIPKAYSISKYVSYYPITETLNLEMGFPDLTPGGLLPDDRKIDLLIGLRADPLVYGGFAKHVAHLKDVTAFRGLAKTEHQLWGFDVHELTKETSASYRSYWLFPSGDAKLFAECISLPRETYAQWTVRQVGGCQITSNVDDRVRIQYYLRKPLMPDAYAINARLVALMKTFMIDDLTSPVIKEPQNFSRYGARIPEGRY